MIVFTEIFGWVGAVLILLAYYLLTTEKIKSSSFIYHFMNLVGAIGIASNSFVQKAWPSTFINVIWFVIALSAIFKMHYGVGKSRNT